MFSCVRDNVHEWTQNFKWRVPGEAVVEPSAATNKPRLIEIRGRVEWEAAPSANKKPHRYRT